MSNRKRRQRQWLTCYDQFNEYEQNHTFINFKNDSLDEYTVMFDVDFSSSGLLSTFPFLRHLLMINNERGFEEQCSHTHTHTHTPNRWILCFRWAIIIIISIHWIAQYIKSHQLALEEKDLRQKVSASLWRSLSWWLRKTRAKGKEEEEEIFNNDNC